MSIVHIGVSGGFHAASREVGWSLRLGDEGIDGIGGIGGIGGIEAWGEEVRRRWVYTSARFKGSKWNGRMAPRLKGSHHPEVAERQVCIYEPVAKEAVFRIAHAREGGFVPMCPMRKGDDDSDFEDGIFNIVFKMENESNAEDLGRIVSQSESLVLQKLVKEFRVQKRVSRSESFMAEMQGVLGEPRFWWTVNIFRRVRRYLELSLLVRGFNALPEGLLDWVDQLAEWHDVLRWSRVFGRTSVPMVLLRQALDTLRSRRSRDLLQGWSASVAHSDDVLRRAVMSFFAWGSKYVKNIERYWVSYRRFVNGLNEALGQLRNGRFDDRSFEGGLWKLVFKMEQLDTGEDDRKRIVAASESLVLEKIDEESRIQGGMAMMGRDALRTLMGKSLRTQGIVHKINVLKTIKRYLVLAITVRQLEALPEGLLRWVDDLSNWYDHVKVGLLGQVAVPSGALERSIIRLNSERERQRLDSWVNGGEGNLVLKRAVWELYRLGEVFLGNIKRSV
ncbi:hypothetical protein GUITHDRAFT_121419 [Guillardia theta CCMP2712]|uniref:Uncharacterized protein n=1 Tax=Guillardia theta (strain CCMP2712) TaxID=905079 RepID=L1I982_GUITC|nr:hypothetical protein GUITHDRAFT_121419 [Guillardia theta CCMP2712]EKX32415.1 hypothetical protein GUITHDRAFT_121419 [Guillardia theta CCMP2712]|eukprot:XP_005819395.1 hypothetical protein GUITHDRAFT_121419 [Guillardia theta CCMP2712]